MRDTGTGIAPEQLPRLFERFHRVEGARGRSIEGSGIGLALVQELVKLHGGGISVDSEQGKGSRFTVTLPFGPRTCRAASVNSNAQPLADRGSRPGLSAGSCGWLDGRRDAPDSLAASGAAGYRRASDRRRRPS